MESDSTCAKAIIYLLEITNQQISKTCRIHKLFTTSKIVYRISVTTLRVYEERNRTFETT